MLATLGGAIIVYGVGWVPAPEEIIGMAVLSATLLFVASAKARSPAITPHSTFSLIRCACVIACGFLIGMAWTGGHAQQRIAKPFPVALEKVPLVVSGYICSVPSPGAWSSVRLDFCVTRWRQPDNAQVSSEESLKLPAKLRLAWYDVESRFVLAGPATLEVSLKRPHGNVNPDGFRYETWLYRQGYLATGSIRGIVSQADLQPQPEVVPSCGWACRYHLTRLSLVQVLAEKAAGLERLALVESLLLGSRGQLEPEDWEVLRATGTSHLVAISGLHVGLIAAIVGLISRATLLRMFADRFGPRMVPVATFTLVCLAAAAYALLAGFTVPTQRALVMVVVASAIWLRGASRRAWDPWLLALFLVLLLDPFAGLDIGLWLSFGAVGCLILAFGGRVAVPSGWRSLVLAQVAITLGLWPILSLLGISTSSVSFFANLFAIPWLSFVIMPVMLIAVPLIVLDGWLGHLAAVVLDGALEVLWWVLSRFAELGAGWTLTLPGVPFWLLVVLVVAGFLVLMPVGRVYRVVVGMVSAALLFKVATTAAVNQRAAEPQVVVLDVGQGLSVLVRDGRHALLYDTGPAGGSFSAAESQVLPTLTKLGVLRLDLLLLSHADGDHAGAWQYVVEQLLPGDIISGEPEALSPAVLPCLSAQHRRIGRWHLQAWQVPDPSTADANGRSCVIEAVYGEHRVVLTGDIGQKQEQSWIAARRGGPVHLLMAPHHGSASSSGGAFVKALQPAYVVFSAGYRNSYGHPHADVVARYQEQGSQVLLTSDTGALTFTFSKEPGYAAERDRAPFWIRPRHARPQSLSSTDAVE